MTSTEQRPRRKQWQHGTPTGYRDKGCRCDPCTVAHRLRQQENRAARKARGLAPDDPRHGTERGYVEWSCRCERCRAAFRTYKQRLRSTR